jgi:VanZ family protein
MPLTRPQTLVDFLGRVLYGGPARRGWAVFVAVTTAFVLYMALAPQPEGPSLPWDKANHVSAFTVLSFGLLHALRASAHRYLVSAVALQMLGVAIELAQLYVPGRSAQVVDAIADAVGIAVGLTLAAGVGRLLRHAEARHSGTAAPGDPGASVAGR